MSVGKQEMTAAGRAFVSRWLADEVFTKYFHPGLTLTLSEQLKMIQSNIRGSSSTPQSKEEEEALNTKVVGWRLATIDGLKFMLSTHEAMEQRKTFSDALVQKMTSTINSHMNEPVPGLEAGVAMIIELTVGILANLPLESRYVEIEYYPPGVVVDPEMMKVEQSAGSSTSANTDVDVDKASFTSSHSDGQEASLEQHPETPDRPKMSPGQTRKSFLGGLVGSANKKSINGGGSPKTESPEIPAKTPLVKEESRVRLCLFLAAQIRGKTVLAKAPVFAT